jgi:hypothetical protein
MNLTGGLRVIEDGEEVSSGDESIEPQIFVRKISTPAGLPWNQSRAAALEARLGAPLPLGEVVYQLRRLEPWSPGQPARWAAFYLRAQAVGDRLEASPLVDGEAVSIVFLSSAERGRRSRRLLMLASGTAAAVAVVILSIGAVLTSRDAAATELSAAEQIASSRLAQARGVQVQKDQTRELDAAGLRGLRLGAVLSDLAWTASAKAPEARILSLHWDHGFMAFEVKSEGAPFTRLDRAIRKADKVGPGGVTLWGVGPPTNAHTAHGASPAP